MKKQILFFIIAVVVVLVGFFVFKGQGKSTTTTGGDGLNILGSKRLTAKQAYDKSLADAKKYAGDGYLVDIYSVTSNSKKTFSDGTSETWYFLFYSPVKKEYKVKVDQGNVVSVLEDRGTKTVEIRSGWIDTDKVAEAGKEKCSAAPENSYFYNFTTTSKSFLWNANCEIEGKREKTIVDAFTGEIK